MSVSAVVAFAAIIICCGTMTIADDCMHGMFFTVCPARLATWLHALLNTVTIGTTATLLIFLNRRYNFVRANTLIVGSVFLLLSAIGVWMRPEFNFGLIMCLVLVLIMFLIFHEYQNKEHAQRSIYLAMAIIGTGCLFNYETFFLLPVVFIGFAQVGAMSFRGFVASLLGLVTPAWIVVGLGLVNPRVAFSVPNVASIWSVADFNSLQLPIIIAAITAIVTLIITVLNLMTVLNYRLQTRLYNAFIVIVAVAAILALCLDFNHIFNYLPILNACLAVQIAHRTTAGMRQLL